MLLISSCGRTTKTELYPNGQKKSEISYSGKKLDGDCKFYYNNGKLQSSFFYIDGKLEGKTQRYSFNGEIISEDFYKNGKLNGTSKIYFDESQGIIKEIKHYSEDSLYGKYTVFYRSGEIKIEGNYYNNLYDSIWNYYDRYGRLIGKGNFIKGNGTLEAYHKNGNVSQITNYKSNEIYGIEKHYDTEGNLIETTEY